MYIFASFFINNREVTKDEKPILNLSKRFKKNQHFLLNIENSGHS